MALRLARYFNMSDEFWMNLQQHFDLRMAHIALDGELTKIIPRKRQHFVEFDD